MDKIFISELTINKIRHLKNITIPLSNEKAKHLIFTGKNGSGKTSVLEALADISYSGIVERYFRANELADFIERKIRKIYLNKYINE